MSGILYIVGTPIGNLRDLSPRAIETLQEVDFIAAEDTRVTLKLLNRFQIKKQMISYHAHCFKEKGDYIIKRLHNGESCAIVTDAGMPCISDPGEDLVMLCHENNIKICAVPGPSAVVTALAMSGLPTSRFSFEGFLSTRNASRFEHLEEIKDYHNTMIFYEAPHKLKRTLEDMYKYLGNRRICLARELTKIYEEVRRTNLEDAINYYEEVKPLGEFVIVIEGKKREKKEDLNIEDAVKEVQELIDSGESISNATKLIAKKTNFSKSELYKLIVKNL